MKNIILRTTVLSVVTSSVLFASGWRLPESSSKSTALSGAYIANSNGADATYYNPANMSFNKNESAIEVSVMNVYLPSIDYTDNTDSNKNGESKKGNTIIPSIFVSSKDYGNNIRYGFSITVPGGLSRAWDTPYQKTYAEEFALKIVEFNPTMAYKLSDNLSVGGGLRAIYSDGVVKSDGTDYGKAAIRDMTGQTIAFGFNLAMAYKASDKSNLSATYRSNVDLKEEGNAKLYVSGTKVYDGGVYVTVPLPAVATLAYAHDINEKTTIEVEFDRTFWSTYKNLDFEYKSAVALALRSSFDDAKARDWEDTDAIRIGLTHKYNKDLTIMFGASKDGNPIPEKSVSFESPDNTSQTISTGFDYNLNEKSSFGFGYLYSKKDDREVKNYNADGTVYIDGKIEGSSAHLVSFSYRKAF